MFLGIDGNLDLNLGMSLASPHGDDITRKLDFPFNESRVKTV